MQSLGPPPSPGERGEEESIRTAAPLSASGARKNAVFSLPVPHRAEAELARRAITPHPPGRKLNPCWGGYIPW